MLVGITGGIGSGKSSFAQMLADRGGIRIDADQVAREVAEYPVVVLQLQEVFGADVLNGEDRLDRRELGRRAFVSEETSQRLEQIMRPPLAQAIWQKLKQASQVPENSLVLLDASLIYEWGSQARFDRIVVVDADEDKRVARAIARGGLREEEIRKRMARQMDPAEKRQRADYVVYNNGDLTDLLACAEVVWRELEGLRREDI